MICIEVDGHLYAACGNMREDLSVQEIDNRVTATVRELLSTTRKDGMLRHEIIYVRFPQRMPIDWRTGSDFDLQGMTENVYPFQYVARFEPNALHSGVKK